MIRSLLTLAIVLFTATPGEAAEPTCRLPVAAPDFLELVSHDRKVSVKAGEPQFTLTGLDFRTFKANLPRIFSSCRMTPIKITGEDAFTHKPREVEVLNYATKDEDFENKRTVLLLPPTGGQNALDDYYANTLCDRGLRVVMVQHWPDDTKNDHDFGSHDRGAMRSTAAVEDVVEYIKAKKPGQLGILGTSVGGINAALILGVYSRISTGALIVAGGSLREVIGTSTEQHLAQLREERMADPAMGLKTIDDYVNAVGENIKIEPLNFVNFAQRKKILSFIATKDVTVPTENQLKLYRAFGSQEVVTHDDDHFGTIKYTSAHSQEKIADFFVQNLSEPTAKEIEAAKKFVPQGNKLCRNARVQGVASGQAAQDPEDISQGAR
jgi:hypothetical protein